jgi:hypothetical protein
LINDEGQMKIFSMLFLIVPFCCDGVGQTTLTREFKLDVFGAERSFIQIKRNPTFAIMGDDDTIMLDDLLSTLRLDRDTQH